jgi:hypothetical protein
MEEMMAIQDLKSLVSDRINNNSPVFKTYNTGELTAVGCQIQAHFGGRTFASYAFADTEEISLIKAKFKILAQVYHSNYPLNHEGLFGVAAFAQQSRAYDQALRSYLAQDLIRQSLAGAGMAIQFPLREQSFIWQNSDRYEFANYCLAVWENPIGLTLVLAIATPKAADLVFPTLVGLGFAKSLEDSAKRAWTEVFDKTVSETLFGMHRNDLAIVERLETLTANDLHQWLTLPKARAVPSMVINFENLNKEILFADHEHSVVRVSALQI